MIIVSLLTSFLTAVSVIPDTEVALDPTYTIPAGNGLSGAMSFVFEEAQLSTTPSTAKLVFRLPALLDGPNGQKFELKGPVENNQIRLSGQGASADCTVDTARTDCQITFVNLKLNIKAAQTFELSSGAQTLSPELEAGRESFEHQAVGTITFFK